jgi:PEP-CTERM motif
LSVLAGTPAFNSIGENIKRLLLTSASLLALMAAAPAASATTFLFSGAIVDFTIPIAGTYQITAFGAQGRDGSTSNDTGAVGGKGAKIQGDFQFAAGAQLKVVVGGAGQSGVYYGGGGSFVVGPDGKPLVVADGGGGAGGGVGPKGIPPTPTGSLPLQSGTGGQTGKDGGDGASARFLNDGFGGSGGSGGNGGLHVFYVDGGGGGFAGNGGDGGGAYGGHGGKSGPAGFNGGGGQYLNSAGGFGGGGGGTSPILVGDYRIGNGEVQITEISGVGAPVPEPSTWAIMATGFAVFGLVGLRRRRKA